MVVLWASLPYGECPFCVMCLREKQAPAEQAFVFLGTSADEYPAKHDRKHDSADSRAVYVSDIKYRSEGI